MNSLISWTCLGIAFAVRLQCLVGPGVGVLDMSSLLGMLIQLRNWCGLLLDVRRASPSAKVLCGKFSHRDYVTDLRNSSSVRSSWSSACKPFYRETTNILL